MKLLWLDLETTGLSPRTDSILEIAISVAELAAPFDAKPLFHRVIKFEGTIQNEFVRQMHTDNGLLAEAKSSGAVSLFDVRTELLGLFTLAETYILAGFSIHFDHAFLDAHLPEFSDFLSHRHYDVSSVKLYCESLGMSPIPKGTPAHRAEGDVLESIAHAKACEKWLRLYGRDPELGGGMRVMSQLIHTPDDYWVIKSPGGYWHMHEGTVLDQASASVFAEVSDAKSYLRRWQRPGTRAWVSRVVRRTSNAWGKL